jgi:hypothetical protein
MLLLLFACLTLHPIYDLHLHALDLQKQSSAIVNSQSQSHYWLTEEDVELVLNNYCSERKGSIEKIPAHTTEISGEEHSTNDIETSEEEKEEEKEEKQTNTPIVALPTIYADDILTQSTYLCKFQAVNSQNDSILEAKQSTERNYASNYLRIHVVGKDRKRIHLISIGDNSSDTYPIPVNTVTDPALYDMFVQREKERLSKYQYREDPMKLIELAPLPFGYQITTQTEEHMILERKYVRRIQDIQPKVAVFKRIEIVDIQLQPQIEISQTTKHIFFSDIEGERVEKVDFEDLQQIRLWILEIMIQHNSIFSLTEEIIKEDIIKEEIIKEDTENSD